MEDLISLLTGASSQKELRNSGGNYYFNPVIQCVCQTIPLLEQLYSKTISEQPLTEAFVTFLYDRDLHVHVGPPAQNKYFVQFFEQLYKSLPTFGKFRKHDSRDLLIEFFNILISEERHSAALSPHFHRDPKTVLTAVDEVFGGHFITVHSCLTCSQRNFVCEYLLDISLSISMPKQQRYSVGGSGESSQLSRQRVCSSAVDKRQEFRHSAYIAQSNELKRVFLEVLNEEQNKPQEEGRGNFTKPTTLTDCLRFYTATMPSGYHCLSCQGGNQTSGTTTPQASPHSEKRTLIYDPPAILLLHMKRFEQKTYTAGFKQFSQKVTYEELLDLGPYCSSDCLRLDPTDKNVWYSLYGVVVHIGTLESGHCIAYLKMRNSKSKATKEFLQKSFLDRDEVATKQMNNLLYGRKTGDRKMEWRPIPTAGGKWICVSDTDTRDATSQEALNQEAFMLFYERVPN